MSDLKKNYAGDNLAQKSVGALEADLQLLDGEYNKCSDMMARGEQNDFDQAWRAAGDKLMKESTFVCPDCSSKVVQSNKASSSSQIRTARAVTEEFGEEAASKSGVISWAKIALSNSERDVQRVLSKQGSKLPIPMSTLTAEGVEIPWLAPTSWMGYIVDQGLWYRLAGLEFHEKHLAPHVWSQFWQNFRALQPHFSLFDMEGFDPRRTCACFLHGDEGRTLKKNGIMVTSLQSCLGTGFDEQRPSSRGTKLVRTLPHDHSNPASFFMPDLWHAFHLGVGKSFVSSAVQLALPFIAAANPHYRDFCKKHRRPPIVSRITGTLVSYRDKTGAVGAWSKGSVTTTMMLWVPALFSDLPHDPLLALAAEGAQKANDMFAFLYRAPAFLSKEEAMSVSSLGADF
ncbi:Uncharacterized protein SCF082_LOCUS42062 [Durusdinium trenchii]|uniref:Uncharacterized protein n=1 Tax=Durusdinium trenchii TaxID=1381693 RepID=A0ABP0QNV9_9DINO